MHSKYSVELGRSLVGFRLLAFLLGAAVQIVQFIVLG